MKKLILPALIIILLIIVFLVIKQLGCKTSENETITIAKDFCEKMEVRYSPENLHVRNERKLLPLGESAKKVVYSDVGNNKLVIKIDCKRKEVVDFENKQLLEHTRKKYTIKVKNTQYVRWPRFLEEKKVGEIVNSIACKLSLPKDAVFSELNLDTHDGVWKAKWKRKYKGFLYEKDYITIWVLAVNGELYAYNKFVEKEPNLLRVKATKSEAIKAAEKSFSKNFSYVKWKDNKDKFEVKSAELNFAKEDGLLDLIYYKRPRLLWVIVIDAKKGMGRDTVGILIKDKSVIKVDPISGEVLSSQIEVVP